MPRRLHTLTCALLALAVATTCCTVDAPWKGEGTEGHYCYPDRTCNPGLTCKAGWCQANPHTWVDSGLEDQGKVHQRDLRAEGSVDQPTFPDWPKIGDQPCATPVAPPTVNAPKKSAHLQVVIAGKAQGSVKVLVSVSGGATKQVPVVGGAFCAEVMLAAASGPQQVDVRAQNNSGCVSSTVSAQVSYQPPTKGVNVLASNIGKALVNSKASVSGVMAHLTDGKLDNKVTFKVKDKTSKCDESTYVWFDLGQHHELDQVVVKYPPGSKKYLTCWDLLVSDKAAPPPPLTFKPQGWSLAKLGNSGSPNMLKILVPPGMAKARHVALIMYENNASSPTMEDFELIEVEAWGQKPAPTCK